MVFCLNFYKILRETYCSKYELNIYTNRKKHKKHCQRIIKYETFFNLKIEERKYITSKGIFFSFGCHNLIFKHQIIPSILEIINIFNIKKINKIILECGDIITFLKKLFHIFSNIKRRTTSLDILVHLIELDSLPNYNVIKKFINFLNNAYQYELDN